MPIRVEIARPDEIRRDRQIEYIRRWMERRRSRRLPRARAGRLSHSTSGLGDVWIDRVHVAAIQTQGASTFDRVTAGQIFSGFSGLLRRGRVMKTGVHDKPPTPRNEEGNT